MPGEQNPKLIATTDLRSTMAPRKDDSKMCRLTCSLKAAYHRVRKQLSWNGLIVSVLIAVVWCLLSLPIIFYHYRPEDATNDVSFCDLINLVLASVFCSCSS